MIRANNKNNFSSYEIKDSDDNNNNQLVNRLVKFNSNDDSGNNNNNNNYNSNSNDNRDKIKNKDTTTTNNNNKNNNNNNNNNSPRLGNTGLMSSRVQSHPIGRGILFSLGW